MKVPRYEKGDKMLVQLPDGRFMSATVERIEPHNVYVVLLPELVRMFNPLTRQIEAMNWMRVEPQVVFVRVRT
uniref:Uncharacterized protein n=1 Tax=viral metagenome TaxID=1070528 RepID=A0A6M3LAI4_9ZZZZ